MYGRQVSADAEAVLRSAGLSAHLLAGGFEGGEDGIDSAQDMHSGVWLRRSPRPSALTGVSPSWVTRARPKTDRIACP